MRTGKTLLVTLLVLAGSRAGTALAAESSQALLNKGNKLFAAGDYAGAYALFQQGNQQSPTPVFLRSMGFSALKAFKHAQAKDAFKAYLEKYPKEKDRRNIADVLKSLEVVVKTRLKITSDPPSAEVYFDVETVGKAGTTPFEGTIEPGRHTVILKLAGYQMTTKTFTIAPEKLVTLSIPMEVTFQVTSRTERAAVRLGSATAAPIGTTPYDGSIPVGKHKVFVTAPGYKSFERDVVATKEGVVLSDVELKLGLRIASKPAGATIEVDGRSVVEGATPLELATTAGKHTVSLKLEGYKPYSQEVTLVAGQDIAIDATLSGGLLSMRTNVSGTKVTVGKLAVGEAPVERAGVPLGKHTVSVENPGRRTWSRAVDFEENQMVQAEVNWRPMWPVWTAVGATVLGAVLWTVGGVKAMKARDDDNAALAKGEKGCVASDSCSYTYHNLGTAGAVITGVSAGAGLLYYLIWGRPSAEIKKVPVAAAQRTTPTRIH